MTLLVIMLVIGGVALVWGSAQRSSLGDFRPTVTVPSQLSAGAAGLDRICAALPAVPAARLIERDEDVLLVSAGPSPRCLSRGGGIFVRISRTAERVVLEGRAKVPLNTNAGAALAEFERQLRQAVEGQVSR
ncbi:MAG: hypothetical protein JWP62_3822 [Blastococcus sp.]|jgi:hypothetical protein|nr:hypothetical protein [Blastococcus sp.]